MYELLLINSSQSYTSLNQLFSFQNILNFGILMVLVLLGVGGRISIDIEISKKSFKEIKFFPRYFLALVLSYVIELYLAEHGDLRKYYAELVILFCIFVNDVLRFILNNTGKIFFYLLASFMRGITDLKDFLVKPKDTNE